VFASFDPIPLAAVSTAPRRHPAIGRPSVIDTVIVTPSF
jgi:hypothetical protein